MVDPDRIVDLLRSPAARWIGFTAGLLGFGFLISHFLRMEPSEVAVLRTQSVGSLAVGLLGYCLFNLLTVLMLRFLVGGPCASIWASAQLVKYLPVPGSAMFGLVGRAVQQGHRGRSALEFMARHTGLLVAGGIAVGSLSVGRAVERTVGGLGTLATIAMLVAGLALGIFAVGSKFRLWKRAAMSGVAAGSWVLLGLLVWSGTGFVADAWVVVSALAAGWVVGLLVLPVPAGLGVREWALTFLLTSELGVENAIAFALITRVLHVASDGIMATGILLVERRRVPLPSRPVVEPPE